jgi:hypothetical protein
MATQGYFFMAAERARLSFPDGKWESLTVSEQSDAIYRELRLIDADVMSERLADPRSQQFPRVRSQQRRTVRPKEDGDGVMQQQQ